MANVKEMRAILQDAAIRFTALRTSESAVLLEHAAEVFGEVKQRSRVRRDKWRERNALMREDTTVGDGVKTCRVLHCTRDAEWRPVLVFPPFDGDDTKPVRVETAMLDVCDEHSKMLDVDAYTENPDVWTAVVKVWTANEMSPPDPNSAEVVYVEIRPRVKQRG